jgi:hypothetical protein
LVEASVFETSPSISQCVAIYQTHGSGHIHGRHVAEANRGEWWNYPFLRLQQWTDCCWWTWAMLVWKRTECGRMYAECILPQNQEAKNQDSTRLLNWILVLESCSHVSLACVHQELKTKIESKSMVESWFLVSWFWERMHSWHAERILPQNQETLK